MNSRSFDRDLRRIEFLARLLDDWFRVPGTRIQFGLDGLVGLIPGVGDAVATLGAVFVIILAARLGVPRRLLAWMAMNVAIDFVVGAVPVLGDAFDIVFKANRRNAELVRRYFASTDAPTA